jgi:NADPH-dependent 2,4-dienoyl-CoA reductase/sulfur reductase-like enzyme
MQDFHYLIIGGGMSADAAVKGIRSIDKKNSIGLISNDTHPPYSRPPLTKALWKGDDESTIWEKTEQHDIALILSRTVTHLNTEKKIVTDDLGEEYSYVKLLLATGGIVNRLPFNAPGIIYYRTYDDYKALREHTKVTDHVVVIGGGFIGSEIAAGLSMNDKKVTMIFPESGVGARNFPKSLSEFVTDYYKSKGVTIFSNDSVADIEKDQNKFWLKTKNNQSLHADVVVAGVGIKPNVELAESIGLTTKNGIVVNDLLQTSHQDIYAAGDVANFNSPHLGKRIRVEHEDNALTMGEMAGKNMAGASDHYHHLPFFYSDLFDLGYEAVGELDSKLETVEDWKEPFREGVIYYLEDGLVRGVLLWNTWNQVDHARELIGSKEKVSAKKLKGLLPK